MATERKIGCNVYRCDKLPADAAISLYLKVNATFAGDPGVLATIATSVSRETAIQAFIQATVASELDGDKVTSLVTEAVALCKVGSDPCIVGVKPQSMEDTIEVAWFALGVQFADFIGAGLGQA